jgi:DNA-binding NarL/FixJ family response regulator
MTKKIALVDDHAVVRQGLTRIINDEPDLEVAAQFATAREAQTAIPTGSFDLVIVDIHLEDRPGLELIKDLRVLCPKLPLLVLSMYDEATYAERAIRAGATGYIMKRAPARSLVAAIRSALAGELWVSDGVRQILMERMLKGGAGKRSEVDQLSDRELEVLQLTGTGQNSRQIAAALGISPKTVETYRSNIKAKLNLRTGAELTRYAFQWVQSSS